MLIFSLSICFLLSLFFVLTPNNRAPNDPFFLQNGVGLPCINIFVVVVVVVVVVVEVLRPVTSFLVRF